MDPTATNALALAALLFLPLLQALCPRLAPDVISGKVIPCRYLCIKINFFELPSIVFSTERDGVLCSTLLLRRRGVCKNGGCVPFESEDQKPKGIFTRVITSIDKFASGSFRKTVPASGAQFGPIVTISPSLVGGGSKDSTGGTSEPASGLSHSSPAAGAGSAPVVKAVSSTLRNIWTQAFPLNLKAPPRARPSTAGTAPSNDLNQTLGGVTASSSDAAITVYFGGSPPTVPPLPTEGSKNESPASGTARGSKLFGSMPGLASALAFRETLTRLRSKNSPSDVAPVSPSSAAGGINLVGAASITKELPGSGGGMSRSNAVNVGAGPPMVPPLMAPGSNNRRPASETPRGAPSSRILSGLTSTIGLGGILNTSHGKKSETGLVVESPSPLATGISTATAAGINESLSGTTGGPLRTNTNFVRGPPTVAPVMAPGSSNENVASEPRHGPGSSGMISRIRTTIGLHSAITKWKNAKPRSGVAPRSPLTHSSVGERNEVSAAVMNDDVSVAAGETSRANVDNNNGGLPTLPPQTATESNSRRPESGMPRRAESPERISELTSAIGSDRMLKTSEGNNSGPTVALMSPSTSATGIHMGSTAVLNEVVSGTINGTSPQNSNIGRSPSKLLPLTTQGSVNENVVSEAPREPRLLSEISRLRTRIAVNNALNKWKNRKPTSAVAPESPSSPIGGRNEGSEAVIDGVVSGAVGRTLRANVVNFSGGLPPVSPLNATGSNREAASETPRGAQSPGILSGLTSKIGLDRSQKMSQGTNNTIGGISVLVNETIPGATGIKLEANTNFSGGLPTGAPMTTPDRHGKGAASEGSELSLSSGAMSTLPTNIASDRALNNLKRQKPGSGAAPVSPSSSAGGTSGGMTTVMTAGASGPSGVAGEILPALVVELPERPPTVPLSTEKETPQISKSPSEKREGSHLPSGLPGEPETATTLVSGTSSSGGFSEVAGPSLNRRGQSTPVLAPEGGAPSTHSTPPSRSTPSGGIFGSITSAASAAVRAAGDLASVGRSTSRASQADSTLTGSGNRETHVESNKAETKPSDSPLKLNTPSVAVNGPTSGGAVTPRRFFRNFLSSRLRRSLNA